MLNRLLTFVFRTCGGESWSDSDVIALSARSFSILSLDQSQIPVYSGNVWKPFVIRVGHSILQNTADDTISSMLRRCNSQVQGAGRRRGATAKREFKKAVPLVTSPYVHPSPQQGNTWYRTVGSFGALQFQTQYCFMRENLFIHEPFHSLPILTVPVVYGV